MSIPYLDPNSVWFPDPRDALKEPNGLIAAGGSLSTEWLLQAYRQGIFPWYEEGQPILWWSPDPRLILLPGDFRVSKSLRKLARKHVYEISFDKNLCFWNLPNNILSNSADNNLQIFFHMSTEITL